MLGNIWFVLIFVLIAGYFILDGFDLGVGVLSPFVAKTDEEKTILRRSIGPVWDGNEVWLLTAGGALFAAFAPAYATTFSGFYLAIMLVLMGLIVRAVAVEYASIDQKWGKMWQALFFIGSLLPALLFGVAIGNVYAGIPLDANGDYTGIPLLGLVTPFTLLVGLLGLSMFLLQGAGWISAKAPEGSDLVARARDLRKKLLIVACVLFLLTTVFALAIVRPEMTGGAAAVLRWLFAIVFVAAFVFAWMKGAANADVAAFVASSVACLALVGILAASMFPNLVVATAGANITVATAASSNTALSWMLGIAIVGVPIVLAYQALIYKKFAGRIAPEDIAH